jgi:integrase
VSGRPGIDGNRSAPDQVAALIKAARQNTYGLRALMISLTYHHALRVSELVGMRWNAIDWKRGRHVEGSCNKVIGNRGMGIPQLSRVFSVY